MEAAKDFAAEVWSSIRFSNTYATLQTDTAKHTSFKKYKSGLGFDLLCATYFLILYKIAPLFGSRLILWKQLAQTHKPVLICRFVSLNRIFHFKEAQSALRRQYHKPRYRLGWPEKQVTTIGRDAKINIAGSTSSGELQTSLLINWLCKKKEVVVSLHNFRCILISRESSLHDRFQT